MPSRPKSVSPHLLSVFLFAILLTACAASPAKSWQIESTFDIAHVWAGHPVGFDLLTYGQHQFVAFYDDQRRMMVGHRTLDSRQWQFKTLPSTTGWDSHNYLTLALDSNLRLHLAGNMHASPLIYFRASNPLDIDSLQHVPKMITANEDRCTYPVFLRDSSDRLLFTYREGASGNGNQIYNVYDPATRSWSRLLDKPLTDGRGRMNAYFYGPIKGPDGFFHLCWLWRNTPDCSTNHDLSYARSSDLIHWQTSTDKPLSLPMTLDSAEIIDPVQPGGGALNGLAKIGFDTQKRPIVTFMKYDENGFNQLYHAHLENGAWKTYQGTHWDYRWAFRGGGSIVFEIGFTPVQPAAGALEFSFEHPKAGSATVRLDEATLQPVGLAQSSHPYPDVLYKAESSFPDMAPRFAAGKGTSPDPSVRFILRWETLPQNRDQPRSGPLPPPSMLRLYQLKSAAPSAEAVPSELPNYDSLK